MGMRPIVPITVSIKKIKGAARQCFIQCEQTQEAQDLLSLEATLWVEYYSLPHVSFYH